jgi:hypothetical protein
MIDGGLGAVAQDAELGEQIEELHGFLLGRVRPHHPSVETAERP